MAAVPMSRLALGLPDDFIAPSASPPGIMNLIAAVAFALLSVPAIGEQQDRVELKEPAITPLFQVGASTHLEQRATRPSTCRHEIAEFYTMDSGFYRMWYLKLDLYGAGWGPICNRDVLEKTIRRSCCPKPLTPPSQIAVGCSVSTPGPPVWLRRHCRFGFRIRYWRRDPRDVRVWPKHVDLPTLDHREGLRCVTDALKCFEAEGVRVPEECRTLSYPASFSVSMRDFG